MKMRSFVFATLGLSMVSSFAVSAAELGSLSLVSRLGEPFDARLVVRDLKEGETAQVTIADDKYYKRIGKARSPESTTLRIGSKADSKGRVRIIGTEPMQLKEFPLILLLTSDGKVKAKVYNVKLAAPRSVARGEGKKTTPTIEHKENLALIPSADAPVTSASSKTKVASPAVKTVKPKAVKIAKTSAKPATVKSPAKKTVVAKKAKAQAAKKVSPKKVAKKISPNQKIRVEKGMTMWSIAQTARSSYPKASSDRIIVGFMRANPEAFKSGATSVRRGVVLRAPTVAEVNAIAEEEARAIVRAKPVVASQDLISTAEKSTTQQSPATAGESDVIEKTIAATSAAQVSAQSAASSTATPSEEGKKADAPATQTKEVSSSSTAPASDKSVEPAASEKATATEKPQTEQVAEKPQVESKVESSKVDTPKEDGGSGTLFATVIFALVVLVGGFFFARKRRTKRTSQGVERLRAVSTSRAKETPVVFRKEEPKTEPSQIDGIEKTVTRRIESDRYAERGFELKGEAAPVKVIPEVSPTLESPKEEIRVEEEKNATEEKPVVEENPKLEEKSTEVSPAETPVAETQIEQAIEASNNRIEPTLGIDLPGKAAQEATTNSSTETVPSEGSLESAVDETGKERTIDAQIEEARALLEGSLSEKALEILEQIALNGDEKQRAAALRLLTLRDRK